MHQFEQPAWHSLLVNGTIPGEEKSARLGLAYIDNAAYVWTIFHWSWAEQAVSTITPKQKLRSALSVACTRPDKILTEDVPGYCLPVPTHYRGGD